MPNLKTMTAAATALALLGACAGTASTGAANLMAAQQQNPDMDAVEFARLDDNNDGTLSAAERQDIGDDDEVLGPNVVVDDN